MDMGIKYYVVTRGEYEDYEIVGVTADKDWAAILAVFFFGYFFIADNGEETRVSHLL